MEAHAVDSRFLFPNPLTCLGEFLIKFSERSLFPVAVRNVDRENINNVKIILNNKASADFWELTPHGMAEMPIVELYERLPARDRTVHLNQVKETDQEALENQYQITRTQTTSDASGFVRIFQRISTPLFGSGSKPIAVSTFSLELTQHTSLLYLLELYKKYYNKKPAAEKIQQYLALDQYFVEALTCSELSTLLALEQVGRVKKVSELMECKPCTVNSHIEEIKNKLKANIDLFMVVNTLRNSRRWQPEDTELYGLC